MKSKKKDKSIVRENLVGVPGALGAAAAGAYALGQGIASDKEVADYSHAMRMWDPDRFLAGSNPGNLSSYMQYASTLSPMAGLRPLGISPSKVLSSVRTSKDLLELAGIPETYSLLTDVAREGTSGAMHYEAYGKGPLAAYTHQLRNMQDVKVPESLSTVQGYKLENYPAWVRKLLDSHVRSKLISHLDANYPHLVPELRHTGQLTPADEITKRLFSARDQENILKDFMGTLTPEQRQFILETEQGHAAGLASQVANYAPLAKGVVSARNALVDASKTLGGAAGGALVGNLAYRLLRNKDKSKRNRWVEGLVTGSGAGLGGLAAYTLGTDGGRSGLLQAVKRLVSKGAAKFKEVASSDTSGRVNWGNVKSHAAASALRAVLGAGIGAGVNQVHEAFVPTTNARERRLKSRLALIGGAGAGLGGGISEAVRDYMNTGFKTVQASETAPGAGYGGYQGLSLQSNMPISQRRQLTAAERKDVDAGQSKWLRGPFASEGDSISARMASPFKRSLLAALATTAAGAGLGAYASGNSGGNPFDGALAGGGLGALGGIPMGILAYLEQQKLNKTLEERMRRLPEGQTTIRDMMSDPVTGYGERMQSFQDQMNPSFSGSQLAQLATLAARMPRR